MAEPTTTTADPNESSSVAYSSETSPAPDATARPATIAPSGGQWTVNGRSLDQYFPNKLHQQLVNEPFGLTNSTGAYDVIARIQGGGASGQAGALRLGVSRALSAVDAEANRPSL